MILLSVRVSRGKVAAGMEVGADAYLTKPIEIEELDGMLRELITPHSGFPD